MMTDQDQSSAGGGPNGRVHPPYTVRVVAGSESWTVWPGAVVGVRLQIHGLSGDVLEVALAPLLDAERPDQLTLRVSRPAPEASGWEDLYTGPVAPLQATRPTMACPKCQHRWTPQVPEPVKCPTCSYRVGAYWRRQHQAAAP